MLTRTLAAAIEPLGPREITARASDETPGRDGLILKTAGIGLANFRRNPVVLAGHDPDRPVGTCTRIAAVGNALLADISFAPGGISATADEVCALCKAGVLNGLSIGFDVLEMGPPKRGEPRTVLRSDLLEISIVAVPALASALVLSRAYLGRRADSAPARTTFAERQMDKVELRAAGLPTMPVWSAAGGAAGLLARWRDFEEARGFAAGRGIRLGHHPSRAERQDEAQRRRRLP